jgi:hypothetical protein
VADLTERTQHRGVLLFGVCLLALLFAPMILVRVQSRTVTDPARYEHVMEGMHEASHFPVAIPSTATSVKFSYSPGPLQAPTKLLLRYALPAPEWGQLRDSLERHQQSQSPTSYKCGPGPSQAGFVAYVLEASSSRHKSVCLNPATHEVIHWLFVD